MSKLWHALPLEEVWSSVGGSERGLTEPEAKKRLLAEGPNKLPERRPDPAWLLFLSQFKSPLMYIMLGAVLLSLIIGNFKDSIYITIVLLTSVSVGFYQEYKVNNSIRALRGVIKVATRVVRADAELEIDASELVPGDIMILRPGDKVPADGRIVESQNLLVNEAVLSGEAKPVEKHAGPAEPDAELAERYGMVFMGTLVEEGSARVVVVETGVGTEYGNIVSLLRDTVEEDTPLQKMMLSLSKFIGLFIFLAVGLIVVEGLWKGLTTEELLMPALALFISAVPEGLLPIITVVLVIGTRRILKHNGLVRRLAATETLGGVTVICTDKTGTLTLGRMTVDKVLVADPVMKAEVWKSCVLSGDGFVENPGASADKLVVRGSLTEQALMRAAHSAGFDKHKLEKIFPLVDRILFSSDHKFSASLRALRDGESVLYVVGAPEIVEARSSRFATLDGEVSLSSNQYTELKTKLDTEIRSGQRLVACAFKTLSEGEKSDDLHDAVKELTIVGFVSITDPVREEVPAAFRETERAGIRSVIVTGDNQDTAMAVAKKVGFDISSSEALTGRELEELSEAELDARLASVKLYSRVSPRHKLRIVTAFQRRGEVVAMFGDGVNDAPAIKAAQIGVAVGSEVDAVREVADIVLLDGSFRTIVKAVEQGRVIFDNIRRVFVYLLSNDFSQFTLFFVSILLGLPLPLLAAQLLLANLVESTLPALALTAEEEKDGIMDVPPRSPKGSIFNIETGLLMISIFVVGGGVAIGFYHMALRYVGDIDTVRTMILVLMCFESLFLTFALRSFKNGLFRKSILSNHYLTGAFVICFAVVVAVVHAPLLQNLFSATSLSLPLWIAVIATNLIGVIIIDTVKQLIFFASSQRIDKIPRAVYT